MLTTKTLHKENIMRIQKTVAIAILAAPADRRPCLAIFTGCARSGDYYEIGGLFGFSMLAGGKGLVYWQPFLRWRVPDW
jgi:hypothetical protein